MTTTTPITYYVGLLAIAPPLPFDITTFTEPVFDGYGHVSLTDLIQSSITSLGIARVIGSAKFTNNDEYGSTPIWGVYVYTNIETVAVLLDVQEFVSTDPPAIFPGEYTYQIVMTTIDPGEDE